MIQFNRSALCFDMILIRKAGDNYNELSVEKFIELPVNERISMIMQKKIRFFAGEEEVPVYAAIKSLDDARS